MDAAQDSTIGRPRPAAARATARSASGCTMPSTPTGASSTGAGSAVPQTSVPRSRAVTPRNIRGSSRHRSKAARLAAIVRSEPAPPATYPRVGGDIAASAARSSSPASTG